MILGYASEFSVTAGGTLRLHFGAPIGAERGRIHVYRWGLVAGFGRWVHVQTGPAQNFLAFPRGSHDQAWGWPPFALPIPPTWKSGVYTALVLPADVDGAGVDPETRVLE